MRLPVLPPTTPPPAEDLYEIRERPPATAARYVRARDRPSLIVPARVVSGRGSSGGGGGSSEEAPTPGEYLGEERRKASRRAAQLNVLLDTRSGRDRRRYEEGDNQAGAGVDVEA
jgi:hypothetical protein